MSADPLTAWVEASSRGEPGAFDRAFVAVYDELHTLAHAQLRRLRPGGTISTTVLVHEAYLRLALAGDLAIERHNSARIARRPAPFPEGLRPPAGAQSTLPNGSATTGRPGEGT